MSDQATGPGPFFASSELEYVQNQGWENLEIWEGTEAECRGKQSYFVAAGATRVRLSPKGDGAWQCRASFPYNDKSQDGNFVDTMELETNAVLRSIYQSPVYRSRFADYNPITRSSAIADTTVIIVADLEKKYKSGRPLQNDGQNGRSSNGKYRYLGTDYDTQIAALIAEFELRMDNAGLAASGAGTPKDLAWRLFYNAVARDVRGFIEYNTVFRRTVTAGNPQAVQANHVGAGMIWTSAEVIQWEGLPTNGWFTLEPDVQWHKDKPRVLSVFGQKTQLVYSYTEIVSATGLLYEAYNHAVLLDV